MGRAAIVPRLAGSLALAMVVVSGCGRKVDPVSKGPPPIVVNLNYLRHLGLDAVVGGRTVRVVSLYATAPDYRPTGSPARDGYEGIASLDDAARAAVAFLRAYELTGDTLARNDALGLLSFVIAMEQGDGEFINFVDTAGRLNRHAPTSRKGMTYWGARAVWALGEAVRVLHTDHPESLAGLRPTLDRAVARLARDVNAGRLIGGSATATAEAPLGLLALEPGQPPPNVAAVAKRTAELLVPITAERLHRAP